MAITSYADYRSKADAQRPDSLVLSKTLGVAGICSLWRSTGVPAAGAVPTTAEVPARTVAGALAQANPVAQLRMMECSTIGFGVTGGTGVWLCDRLSHQGGLSGTVTTAQTTNLPTAALTRYTDGVGVVAALEIYTAVGTTATTATVAYTNEAGNGATSQAFVFGGSNYNAATRLLPIPLDAADYGVRAVQSVTLTASTVSAAGNFGVTLFKPLAFIPATFYGQWQDYLIGNGLMTERILSDACLFFIQTPGGPSTTNSPLTISLNTIDA